MFSHLNFSVFWRLITFRDQFQKYGLSAYLKLLTSYLQRCNQVLNIRILILSENFAPPEGSICTSIYFNTNFLGHIQISAYHTCKKKFKCLDELKIIFLNIKQIIKEKKISGIFHVNLKRGLFRLGFGSCFHD